MIMKTLHTIYSTFAKHNMAKFLTVLTFLFTLGVGSMLGADYTKNESWTFTTSGNANWKSVNCESYCGAWGKNKNASPSVYKTDIQNFINVDFSKYENVSLTIYVTAAHNSGTNSYTVKLIDKDGNQVSNYTVTKKDGMGSGSNSGAAKESSVTFSPTQSFSGYRIDFNPKSFITKTRYVLTYDDKAASYTITAESNNTSYGTVTLSGTKITASPKTGYRVSTSSPYTISPASSATVTQNGNTFTVAPTANTTITINFEAIPTHKVYFSTGGLVDIESVDVQEGQTYNITQTPASSLTQECEYNFFVGWTKSTTIANPSSKPTIVNSIEMESSDITLYAVYSKTEGGGGSAAEQGTTMFSENWTGCENNKQPTQPTSAGSVVYNAATITYEWKSSGSTSQTYTSGGPNGNENILISKNNGYWKVVGIPTGQAETLTLSSSKSGSGVLSVSTSTSNVSISGSTITIGSSSVNTFDLIFTNTNSSSNLRLDDISVVVAKAGATGTTTYSLTPNCTTTQTATYTVNHYQQNIADDNYTLKETQTLSGEVGTSVTPAVKSYTGFKAPSTKTVTIKSDGSTVVNYQYTRNSYTLTWDVNEGNALTGSYTSGSVKFGATITKPADPTRDEYKFIGWHDGTEIVTPATTMPANDLTYTAQWKETYTVTWLVEGQPYTIGNPTTTVEEGQNITAIPSDPPLLTCAVKFMGWSIESSGSTPEDPSYYSDLFTTLDEAEAINIDDNKTFHAVFATNAETIEGAGTEWVKTELSAVTEGTYALLTTDGYAFNGSISSGHGQVTTNAFSFTDNIATSAPDGTCEITFEAVSNGFKMYNANNGYLYAKDNSSGKLAWHAEETSYWYSDKYSSYNWTYNANDALLRSYNNNSIRTYSGISGNLLVLAKKTTSSATVFTAYITSCCQTEAPTDGSIDGVEGSGNAMSVTLHWKDANDYKRYHVVCDELEIDEYVEKTDFETKGVQELSECTTYIFKVSSAPKEGCESPVLEIEATPFIPKTIAFEDGANTTKQSTTCDSQSITVPTPTAQNCSTYVWIDKATGTEYTAGQTITPAKDMTIDAKWSVITYTITFNDWDGTQLQQSTVECGQTPVYNGETPTHEQDAMYEYEFARWTPTIEEADDNTTYTATYNKTKRTYTVDWYVNGKLVKNETVEAGESATAPDIVEVPCGAVIAGWTDAEGGKYEHDSSTLHQGAKPSIQILSNKKFYAVFADIDE